MRLLRTVGFKNMFINDMEIVQFDWKDRRVLYGYDEFIITANTECIQHYLALQSDDSILYTYFHDLSL